LSAEIRELHRAALVSPELEVRGLLPSSQHPYPFAIDRNRIERTL
jgi:hypothetical protein